MSETAILQIFVCLYLMGISIPINCPERNESDKRRFLMNLVDVEADARDQDAVTRHISIQAGNRIVIQKILNEQELVHESFLTDNSFQKLLLYLGIMVNRNLQGEYVEVQEKIENGKYLMAQDILKYITQYCHVNTTEDEVWFLSRILASSRLLLEKLKSRLFPFI